MKVKRKIGAPYFHFKEYLCIFGIVSLEEHQFSGCMTLAHLPDS